MASNWFKAVPRTLRVLQHSLMLCNV